MLFRSRFSSKSTKVGRKVVPLISGRNDAFAKPLAGSSSNSPRFSKGIATSAAGVEKLAVVVAARLSAKVAEGNGYAVDAMRLIRSERREESMSAGRKMRSKSAMV